MRPLRSAKLATLYAAKAAGLYVVASGSEWRRQRLMILCYHGVSLRDEHSWSDAYVSEVHLRRRFLLLKRWRYNVLPLGDAIERLYRGSLPKRSVVLTFDDGTYDFYVKVCPILRELGYIATLYQTTYYCTFQRPVFDPIISYLLWRGTGRVFRLGQLLNGGTLQVPVEAPERNRLCERIRAEVTKAELSAEDKDEIATQLAYELGVDYEEILRSRILHLMTREEIGRLDPNLVDIQLHTHRHRTPRDQALFARELSENRDAILGMLPYEKDLNHFCYPSGDYSDEFIPWLSQSGVLSATTCDTQIATRGSDPFLLPRFVDTMSTPEVVFEGWLSGIASWLPQPRR